MLAKLPKLVIFVCIYPEGPHDTSANWSCTYLLITGLTNILTHNHDF